MPNPGHPAELRAPAVGPNCRQAEMDAIGLAVDGEGLRCIERRGARSSDDKKAEPPGPSGVPGVLLAFETATTQAGAFSPLQ